MDFCKLVIQNSNMKMIYNPQFIETLNSHDFEEKVCLSIFQSNVDEKKRYNNIRTLETKHIQKRHRQVQYSYQII